jgi:hypothetical protein
VSEVEIFFEKKVSKNLFVSAKCTTFAAGKLSKTENRHDENSKQLVVAQLKIQKIVRR